MSPLTQGAPKCLLKLGGQTLLSRNIHALRRAGFDDILLVRGENHDIPAYDSTPIDGVPAGNMVSSLMLASRHFNEDIVIVYGDVLYGDEPLASISWNTGDYVVPVDLAWRRVFEHRAPDVFAEAESCRYDEQMKLLEIGRTPATPTNTEAQFMGLIRFSKAALETIGALWAGTDSAPPLPRETSSTDLLQRLIDDGKRVQALPMQGGWFEFDSPADYARAILLADTPEFAFLGPLR